jgi:hypothetical protein
MGQWTYSLITDKLTTTMQIAQRIYSLAEEQSDATLIAAACRALAASLYFLGDFEASRRYAMRGVNIWRSGDAHSDAKDLDKSLVICMCYEAFYEWHVGEIASSRVTIAESVSLAKELNNWYALAIALWFAAILSHFEGNLAEVERLASDLTELSTRHSFAHYLADGKILRGWARSTSGDTAEGVSLIEDGIEDHRATGSTLVVPLLLALKAEALHLADRTSEALEAIKRAETLAERLEERWCCAELHRLRGVFLAGLGSQEAETGGFVLRSHQNREGAEVGFARETRRSNVRGIPSPKSERVRRTWIPTASLVTSSSSFHSFKGFRWSTPVLMSPPDSESS